MKTLLILLLFSLPCVAEEKKEWGKLNWRAEAMTVCLDGFLFVIAHAWEGIDVEQVYSGLIPARCGKETNHDN